MVAAVVAAIVAAVVAAVVADGAAVGAVVAAAVVGADVGAVVAAGAQAANISASPRIATIEVKNLFFIEIFFLFSKIDYLFVLVVQETSNC